MVMLLVSSEMCMSVDARDGGENGKICGKGMNAARQSCEHFSSMAIHQPKAACHSQVASGFWPHGVQIKT